jgi:hypothetical protein
VVAHAERLGGTIDTLLAIARADLDSSVGASTSKRWPASSPGSKSASIGRCRWPRESRAWYAARWDRSSITRIGERPLGRT